MKKKYLLWLLYTLLPLYILLFQCGLKTYAGTDPRYEGTGYLLTSGDMLQILNDITKTNDVTYTEQEIINMTTNYNQWATNYHQQNPTFCTNNVLFYYGLKYENTINVGTKDICFLISRNLNLNVNYTYIYLNAASWNLESGYIQLLGLGELVGSPGNYTDNGVLTPLIYVFGPNKTVWSNENFRVGEAQCKYKSINVESDGTNKYAKINTMTTTLYSATSNVDKYEVFLRYPNSTRDFYYLTNHTRLNGSGEEIIPTPTPTPTPTPIPSGDNSGDSSGDVPEITPTPIDYTGKLEDINDTINSGDRGIIASIGNLGGTIINGIENVLKTIFNWAMELLFEPNIELIQDYIDGLQESIGRRK